LILGMITKGVLVPPDDAEATLDEFEKNLVVTMRAKEAQLVDIAATRPK
jgi:hypothetical protein